MSIATQIRRVAYLVCVTVVSAMVVGAQPAAAAAALAERATGVQIVTGDSYEARSEPRKIAYARCPDGKRVLGGGARVERILGGTTKGKVMLDAAAPISMRNPDGSYVDNYYASAEEWVGGYSDDWRLIAYAVCGDPIDGLLIVERHSSELSDTQPFVRKSHASCPGDLKVIGTGGVIHGANHTVSLRQIRPNQQGAYVFVEGIAYPGYTPDFEVWAYAVCAKAPLGWHVAIDGNGLSTAQVQATSVACPPGEQVLGAGFTKGDEQGVSHIEYVFPYTTSTISKVYLGGGAALPPQPWNIAAWAVCVTR